MLVKLRVIETVHFLHVFHKRILSWLDLAAQNTKFLGSNVNRFLFPASHSIKRRNQILVEITVSSAIFDWVQSLIEFAVEILLVVDNSFESNFVLTWRFSRFSRPIILKNLLIILVFLEVLIILGIELKLLEVWISSSVAPFVERGIIYNLFLVLLIVRLF